MRGLHTRRDLGVSARMMHALAPAGIKQSRSHCNKYSSRKSFESLFEKYASIIFIPFSEAKFVFIDVEITIFFSLLCRKNEKYRIIIFYRGEKLIK